MFSGGTERAQWHDTVSAVSNQQKECAKLGAEKNSKMSNLFRNEDIYL